MSTYEFYVGTYANEAQESILKYKADFENGTFEKESAYVGTKNPSYLLFNKDKEVLYAVEELNPIGGVCAFDVKNGYDRKYRIATDGADPCHLSLDESGRFLNVANYSSGSLAVYAVGENGIIAGMSDFVEHTGKGVHPTRQEGPHIHFSYPHGGKLYVVDLGVDTVFCYDVDAKAGRLVRDEKRDIKLPAGAGPRHFVFSDKDPDVVYILGELSSKVYVYNVKEAPVILQEISTLPEGYDGSKNTDAAIKLSEDGKYLFASNRGHDSIASFKVGEDMLLTLCDICKTGGEVPRDFTQFGSYIVAANQKSDLITVLKIDEDTGKLTLTDMKAEITKPVCIAKI